MISMSASAAFADLILYDSRRTGSNQMDICKARIDLFSCDWSQSTLEQQAVNASSVLALARDVYMLLLLLLTVSSVQNPEAPAATVPNAAKANFNLLNCMSNALTAVSLCARVACPKAACKWSSILLCSADMLAANAVQGYQHWSTCLTNIADLQHRTPMDKLKRHAIQVCMLHGTCILMALSKGHI
eukprot:GHRR01001227.1.p1 GENE.GHRR01001227.1~~GHRR01001227.1.p1  ORF type:complete len:187 (+),score=57.05 GHRR01001227.1:1790-2350(+)